MVDNAKDYEFQDLVKNIEDRLKEKQGWGDSFESSVGETLIDISAEAADILSYMLERRSQENFLNTARLDSSVYAKASEQGYKPKRTIAPQGVVEVTLTDDNGAAKLVASGGLVVIEERTPLTFEGENFITLSKTEFDENDDPPTKQIDVIQGVQETITFDLTDDQNFNQFGYVLIENFRDIAENSIIVTSSNNVYKDVTELPLNESAGSLSFLPGSGEKGRVYDLRFSHDGMRIQFGNGVFGVSPTGTLEVSFVRTKGKEVRIPSTGNEFNFNFSTLFDNVNPPNQYNTLATNIEPITGGADSESPNEIRTNAPLTFITNNRAVSVEGYTFWAKNSDLGNIVDAKAFGEKELDTVLFNLNNVYITYLKNDPQNPELDPTEKQRFIDFIKQKDVLLAHIITRPADEIKLRLDISVKPTQQLPLSPFEVYDIIFDYLEEKFKPKEGSIGNEFQKSDIIKDMYGIKETVNNVEFTVVDFVDLSMSAVQFFTNGDKTDQATFYLKRSLNEGNFLAGDTLDVTINGQTVTVTVETSDKDADFVTNILFKMRDKINAETNVVAEVLNEVDGGDDVFYISIFIPDDFGTFTISRDETQDSFAVDDVVINKNVIITPSTFELPRSDGKPDILQGSLKIKKDKTDETGNNDVEELLFFDDGNGSWIDASTDTVVQESPVTGNVSDSVGQYIDYLNSVVTIPPGLADGNTFFFEYKQNRFENFAANPSAFIRHIPPKVDITIDQNELSTIEVLQ